VPDQAVESTVTASDPYDLGDTGLNLEVQDQRPRNPDGTFAKVNPEPPSSASVATTAPTPPALTQPVANSHPQYLVDAAANWGFTSEEIAASPTHILAKTVHQLQRNLILQRQQTTTAQTLADATVRQPEPEPDIDLGLSSEDLETYDPKIIGAIKKAASAPLSRVKQLENELAQERHRSVARDNQQACDLIDAAFGRLGKDYTRLFGDGAGRDLSDQRQFKRRIATLQEAGIDMNRLNRATLVKQIREAADLLYGTGEAPAAPAAADPYTPALAKPAGTNGRISEQQWDAATLARPTQRSGSSEPAGDEKAVKNLTKNMRDAGMLEAGPDSDVLDGLL
jgi:hypothetical protein